MLLALLTALGLASPVHVQASLLQLRQAPDAEAAPVAWLRIGTAVDVVDEEGEWVQVHVTDRPDAFPVSGWVRGRFLDVDAPTPEGLERDALLARQVEDRATLRDRRMALLGGEVDRAEPVHVAVCEGERVELLGVVEPDGSFSDRSQWTPSRSQLLDLSALHWTETVPGGEPAPISGSPFVRPFVTERWNEQDPSPFAPGTCDGICETAAHVILGPCEQAGTLYTSQPVASGSLGSEVVSETVHQPYGDYQRLTWTLRSDGWSASVDLGETELGDTTPQTRQTHHVVLPGGRVLAVGEIRRATVRGWSLLLADEGGFQEQALYLEGWGC